MESRVTGKQKMIVEAIRVEAIAQGWSLERDKKSKAEEPLRCQNFFEAWEPLMLEVIF